MALVVPEWTGSLLAWEQELAGLKARLAGAFGRAELRRSAGAFIDGALSGVARKTGWQLAEQAGLDRPYRLQSLLGRSAWEADNLRDLVRAEVLTALGDAGGVLVVDETGFPKKGTHSVGVARQYSGTAGRIENCQVGVFVAYASRWGQALIDRRLYLPTAWTDDAARLQRAAVPEAVACASKSAIAAEMIAAALDAGTPCAWVMADDLYGAVIDMLEMRGQPYMVTARSNRILRFRTRNGWVQTDLVTLANARPATAWTPYAAGEGSKGLRLYDWTRIALPWPVDVGFKRWLLIRRSRRDPDARVYHAVFAPAATGLAEMVGAAGLRWTIEECFQRAKEELGLDHCEARSWHGWHRHMTLCMAAGAFLAGLQAASRRTACSKPNRRSPTAAA